MTTALTHQRGQEWLETLLRLAGWFTPVQEVLPEVAQAQLREVIGDQEADDLVQDTCWLRVDTTSLQPGQIQALIGEGGSVLDSVQYLANAILNLGLGSEEQQAYTVDVAGYRLQRLGELKAIALEAAAKVRATAEPAEIAGLSAAERRQVHTFLKSCPDLVTSSHGAEPDRRLVVGPAAAGNFQEP